MTSSFDDSNETNRPTVSHHMFNNKWDLASTHMAPVNPAGIEASHDILDTLRTKRGSQTAQWLNDLQTLASNQNSTVDNISDSQTEESTNNKLSSEQTMLNTAIRGLDKLFDEFENYASRFNITAEGTDFIVSCARPIRRNATKHVYGVVDNSGLSYAGHIATRFWAMIIRAIAGAVEVFIIPADLLLAFSVQKLDEAKYKPLLVVQGEFREDKLIWHIDNTIITIDQVPLLAKELFGDLIRVATGQMSESELFAHPLQELSLGESLAIGYTTNKSDANLTKPTPSAAQKIFPAPAAAPSDQLSLTSINIVQQLLPAVDKDINQLLESGKQALQADDNNKFQKIKVLTETMEALKIALTNTLNNLS